MFERAIALDAGYAPAWAGLATVHATLYEWFGARDDDLAQAERASQRALKLAPDLAEAHVARGFALSLSRRYDEAARGVRRRHPPQSQPVRRLLLLRADQLRARRHRSLGRALSQGGGRFARRTSKARCCWRSRCACSGEHEEATEAGREGIRRAEHVLVLNPLDGRALSLGLGALFEDGQPARAMEWSRRALELYPDDMSALINAACLHAKLRPEGRSAAAPRARVCARLGQARLGRTRPRLRHPARRPAVQEAPGAAQMTRTTPHVTSPPAPP